MPYSRTGAGLHRFTDPADGRDLPRPARRPGQRPARLRGLRPAGPEGARQRGGHRARVLDRDRERPGRGRAGDGRWELAATPPISPYLVTLVAGPYHSISAEHHGIPFGLHARQSLAGRLDRDASEILAVTRACFDRYREIFAEPFPYDSYDQAFVPELEAGAMENPGCVTFRDDFLFPSAVTQAERQTRGSGDRARDGAHVVRRPGHHALVERRVAERVVRRVPGLQGAGGGHRLHRGVDRLRAGPQDPRLRRGPARVHPPGRPGTAGGSRHRRRPVQLRRHLLRQGRGRAAPAGGLAGLAGLPGRDQRLLRALPVRQRDPGGPARLPEPRAAGADVGEWAASWLRSAGRGHPVGQPPGAAGPGRLPQPRRRQAAPAADRGVRRGTGRAHAARPVPGAGAGRRARGRAAGRRGPPGPRPAAAERRRSQLLQGPARSRLAGRPGGLARPPARSAQPRGRLDRRPRPGPGRGARAAAVPRAWRPGTCPPRPRAPSPGT